MWKLKLGGAKTVSRLLLITKLSFFSLPVPLSFSGLIERNGGGRGCVYVCPLCAFFTLWLCFEFCVSVLSFVFLFWVLCFCFDFCDSVLSFVFLFWVLWFCFEFCDSVLNCAILFRVLWFCFGFCCSVLGFCDFVLGFCDSVLSFVILFCSYRPP